MAKRIVIAGENPFVKSLHNLCALNGYKVDRYLIEDLDDREILDEMVLNASRCDIFIETLNESAATKLWLIEGVEVNLKERTPILTNCLCTTATEVASWCSQPQRVIGFGLLPPILSPGVVEFAPALQSDFQSAAVVREFFSSLSLDMIRVPDTPGLVRGRIILTMINTAIFALNENIASLEDIDKAIMVGLQAPRGLLAWADEIGLDVVLGAMTGIFEFFQEERYRPAPLLRQKVRAGHLGKKTGRGFFIDPLVEPPNA